MLFITAFIARPDLLPETRRPKLRFEVLVPYTDPSESTAKKMPADTRHSFIVEVWAADKNTAAECARERFREHRIRARSARMAPEGPVALRVVRPE